MADLFNALIYDTESTDLPQYGKDNPADGAGQPRIVSIAAALVGQDEKVIAAFDCLIKPDGWKSSPEALNTHGITIEMGEAQGIPIADALDQWTALHAQAALTATFNHAHDSKLMRGELRRIGRPDLYGALPDFCCMHGSRKLCGKLPNLALACRTLLGIDHNKATGAHSAIGDRDVTIKLYLELVRRSAVMPKVRQIDELKRA